MTGVQYEPLDNGLDYLESVVENLRGSPTPRQLKYAVLHLAAGVEVVLKARLLNEDWRLVFENQDVADEDALVTGMFRSVGIHEAIRRLRKEGVRIDKGDELAVTRSYQRRNALQHFGLNESAEAIKASSAATLDFLVSFIGTELLPEEPDVVVPVFESIKSGLQEIEGFVELRLAGLEPTLRSLEVVVACPSCGQPTFVPGDCDCRFCFYTSGGQEAAEEYVWTVLGESEYEAAKGRTSWSLHTCPDCEDRALVGGITDQRKPHLYWCCFTEGWALDYSQVNECERCGALANFGMEDFILLRRLPSIHAGAGLGRRRPADGRQSDACKTLRMEARFLLETHQGDVMSTDESIDVVATQRRLRDFAEARAWGRFHSPKNLVMALASETGELLDLFRWLTEDESRSLGDGDLRELALELGDIQIFLLRLADVLGISLSQAVEDKLAVNEEKYPVEIARDSATKYSRRATADPASRPER